MRQSNKITSILVSFLYSVALSGCTTIQLVSNYDEQTDNAATQMEKDVSSFFVKLDSALTPAERSFQASQDFYQKQAVAIAAMKIRADAVPQNDLTSQQIQLVNENLAYLALLHKGCVTAALTDTQRAAVHDKGIDASAACRTAYGASVDLPNQSAATLNPAVAMLARQQIDIGLEAIIKFEMAKKRGAK